ncbi:hypothetical protein [Escherichia phage ULINTec4]|jgi:hypothetical protein|uniref:Uncharacterized protein n=5 Tax=Vectrevirus TaxID=2732928 RepID=A0A9E7S260_9CAUD|nr:hypothetical protein HOS42_gp10 [Escherichia phage mutPK1A2]AQY55032.1 hypothetical protein [Escherichia phage K1E]UCR91763.1 hypothetical protein [Escherichia phage ULINTec4]URP75057.1 hypothetical protein EEc2_0009 [Escherichia phage EEc2]URP75112.1 hypothetical protein EEc4_0008 [Escherichia phage EEc4]URY99258.1 hypothetical protein 6948_0018 [Escherichia phage 6948]
MRNFEKMTRKANRFDMEEGQTKGKKLNKPVRDRASKRAAWEF